MKFPLTPRYNTRTRKKGEEIEIIEVDIREIRYVTREGKKLIFHLITGEYYGIFTLETAQKWLEKYGFRRLDNSNLVNIETIEHIDEDLNVHFKNMESTAAISVDYLVNYEELDHLVNEINSKFFLEILKNRDRIKKKRKRLSH
ncbi:LytTR family transcriptional regulator DNA-binding domain-containing protein [Chengkuizengella axinellae]|uniref:LytTR family transcriptional regulator DNA-binding domain-containing protein n=1 Tax=Chengkuizengella axinellae TaxID=3064388 RepID=A0ABT9IYI2_9BACL|nr:LytTR family transcriptional regulator DNA-binding domain-containing protein [Chengkuizengella sp. 2205SS18-9]MDP5274377.1 LytTR family transcriptional regulator DNA-binding domain-containing protein [Chengkuizengella sp. 2205SS18-9]